MNGLGSTPPVVELRRVTKLFGSNDVKSVGVQDASFRAHAGELVLVAGPSGSGKTTMLTLIAGLLQPTSGTVSLFGRDISHYSSRDLQDLRARNIGFVFQTFHLIDALSAAENIGLVLRFAGEGSIRSKRRAFALLQKFRIDHLSLKYPSCMSQGEKQRVAVARAVANDADLIIADEPTACLEIHQGIEIIRLLHKYAAEEKRCVIVASHDTRIVELADRVLRLEDGILHGFKSYNHAPKGLTDRVSP
jgi:putative ABC transport system ATP-binding protein